MGDVVNGRYRIVSHLGAGAMGRVDLAEDLAHPGSLVALKRVESEPAPGQDGGEAAEALIREFDTLARLRHPGLPVVHDFGRIEGTDSLFITMEYVQGVELTAAAPGLDPAGALEVVAQICRVLEFIHTRGLVHRDLKPENVLVAGDAGAPRACLLDFGLASRAREEAVLRGTLHYVAPEILRGDKVDGRADLYALGVILFRLAAGRCPYEGTPKDVLRGHLEGAPPCPMETAPPEGAAAPLRPVLNESLSAVILKLLDKDPSSRYRSAAEALRAIDRATGSAHAAETTDSVESYAAWAPLVGREKEMAALEAALGRGRAKGSRAGAPEKVRVVLVAGEAGSGKTRFLLEAKRRAQVRGSRSVLVVCGAATPAFQPIVEAMALLGAGAAPLGPPESGPPASPEAARLMVADAAAAALAARTAAAPAILFIDDAHLADEGSLSVLEAVARGGHGPCDLGLVLAFRPEEVEGSALEAALGRLGRHARAEEVPLRPLAAEETASLVEGMLGLRQAPAGLVDLLQRETSGNPLFVEQAVQALIEDGTISRVGGAFRADVDDLTRVSFPMGAGEAIRRRLARLAPEEARVLETLSAIGRPAGRALLHEAVDLPALEVDARLASLQERKLVEETGGGPALAYAVAGARVRECAYEGIDFARRREIHGRIAAALESAARRGEPVRREEVARHLMRGPDPATGLARALEAAERAWSLGAAAEALDFYRGALDLVPPGAGADRAEIHWKTGSIEKALGRNAEAMESFDRSLRAAGEALRRDLAARARMEKASLHVRRGRVEDAVREVEQAQELLAGTDSPALMARSQSILASALGRAGKLERALEVQRRALDFAEKAGAPEALASVLNNLGLILCLLGRQDEGFAALERAIETRRSLGDRHGELETTSNLGKLLAAAGAFDRALVHLEACRDLARTLGDLRALVESGIYLGDVRAGGCWYDRALAAFEEAAAVARRIGEEAQLSHALDAWGTALREFGDLEAAHERHLQALEAARRAGSAEQEAYALASVVIDRALEGNLDAAREALRRAERIPAAAVPPGARMRLAEAASRVRLAAGEAAEAEAAARELLDRARAERIRAEAARAHLLIGLAREKQGDAPGALAALAEAAEEAAACGAEEIRWRSLAQAPRPKEAAAALEAAASRIGDEETRRRYLAAPERAKLLAAAAAPAFDEGLYQPTAGGALAALYRMSEIVTSAADLDDLLARVLDLALAIVRAERGLVILVDEDGERQEVRAARGVEPETIADALEYSRNVVRTAAAGETMVTLDAAADRRFHRFGSVALFQIKSLACIPMVVRDRVLGTVYLDSRKQGYLFRDEDVAFLRAFANLAASAIEMARLNAKLSSENLNLRREVQDLRKAAGARTRYQSLVGKSVRMQALYDLLDRVSASTLSVLITGESGTGKELVARALHFGGPRRERKFFSENVAAIPDTLLESELFGHVRGAFTGADRDRKGVFELASGGTLFLDEIGDMSLPLQSKLLRALQEGEIRPVGGKDAVKVDVRIVSATNRDLETMVKEGRFREDLYYRLNVVRIHIPPLRERKEDIPLLLDHFFERAARAAGASPKRLDIAALQFLLRYDWPGNVRELENEVMKLAVLCPHEAITQNDLAENRELFEKLTRIGREQEGIQKLDEVERRQIERALAESGGNRLKAAQLLGISRATIYRKLKEYGITG